MRILGIDPGSRICGYGMIVASAGAGGEKLSYVECGVISAPEGRPAEERLGEIARGLAEVLDELQPDVVALEEVFSRINVKSALALAQARGMALAVIGLRGVTVASYTAPLVKKTITGRGRAEKEQVARMVAALVGLKRPPRADAADALALAITHARAAATATVLRGARSAVVLAGTGGSGGIRGLP